MRVIISLFGKPGIKTEKALRQIIDLSLKKVLSFKPSINFLIWKTTSKRPVPLNRTKPLLMN